MDMFVRAMVQYTVSTTTSPRQDAPIYAIKVTTNDDSSGFIVGPDGEAMKGGKVMEYCNIRLSLAENVKRFVDIVSRHSLEIDVKQGRHVVDGSSLPGVISLDLSKQLSVAIYGDKGDEVIAALSQFIVG